VDVVAQSARRNLEYPRNLGRCFFICKEPQDVLFQNPIRSTDCKVDGATTSGIDGGIHSDRHFDEASKEHIFIKTEMMKGCR
jgi:hypothetical protein